MHESASNELIVDAGYKYRESTFAATTNHILPRNPRGDKGRTIEDAILQQTEFARQRLDSRLNLAIHQRIKLREPGGIPVMSQRQKVGFARHPGTVSLF